MQPTCFRLILRLTQALHTQTCIPHCQHDRSSLIVETGIQSIDPDSRDKTEFAALYSPATGGCMEQRLAPRSLTAPGASLFLLKAHHSACAPHAHPSVPLQAPTPVRGTDAEHPTHTLCLFYISSISALSRWRVLDEKLRPIRKIRRWLFRYGRSYCFSLIWSRASWEDLSNFNSMI